MRNLALIVSLVLFVLLDITVVRAETLSITGNGADSKNSVQIEINKTNKVTQSNNATINNDVKSEANTGGNNVDGNLNGGSVVTGDAQSKASVNNNFNNNSAVVDDCCKNGENPPPPPPPVNPPVNPPSNGGRGGDPGSSSSSDPGKVGGAVLGLSATAGPEPEQVIFYVGGAICLSLSGILLRKNLI